jgi:peptide/nickel transport system substrate-binding protein
MLFLSGCASAPSQAATLAQQIVAPTPTVIHSLRGVGGTLHIYFWQAPATLNPHLATAAKDWAAARVTYEPLASFDKDGNLTPFLAAEIPTLENGEVAKDGKSVTWKLKQNVRWSDGVPFTADDVKFTYDYIINPKGGATSIGAYSDVASVAVLDPYTVRVNFKGVNPAWSLPFVGIPGMILPKHVFANYTGVRAASAPANLMPVGTGPYRVVSFKPQEMLFLGNSLVQTNLIVYEPNPYFRDPNEPYFSRVELTGGGTATEAARSVLQFGDVDYANNLQIDATLQKQLEAYGKGKVLAPFGAFVERLELNFADPNQVAPNGERASIRYPNPFFSDIRVRQAFAYAIDREAIAKLYGPTGKPTTNILVSPSRYESQSTSDGYNFDLKKAAALLDQAGWTVGPDGIRQKNGVRLSVLYQTSANPVRQQTQQIIKNDLQSIGVSVQLTFYDSSVFFNDDPNDTRNRHHFYADIQEYANGNQSPYPGPYMESWTCAEIAQKSNNWTGANTERWCNPAYDALYQQSTTELDPAKSQQLFIQMNDLLVNNVVMIPLVRQADISGVSNNLIGIDPTPWDADLWNIKDWRRNTP